MEVVGTVSQISEPNQWTSLTEISADHNTDPKQQSQRPGGRNPIHNDGFFSFPWRDLSPYYLICKWADEPPGCRVVWDRFLIYPPCMQSLNTQSQSITLGWGRSSPGFLALPPACGFSSLFTMASLWIQQPLQNTEDLGLCLENIRREVILDLKGPG